LNFSWPDFPLGLFSPFWYKTPLFWKPDDWLALFAHNIVTGIIEQACRKSIWVPGISTDRQNNSLLSVNTSKCHPQRQDSKPFQSRTWTKRSIVWRKGHLSLMRFDFCRFEGTWLRAVLTSISNLSRKRIKTVQCRVLASIKKFVLSSNYRLES